MTAEAAAADRREKRERFKSTFLGVSKSNSEKWRVRVHYNGRQIHIGRYDSELEAARAYDNAILHIIGEEAQFNFGKETAKASAYPLPVRVLAVLEGQTSAAKQPAGATAPFPAGNTLTSPASDISHFNFSAPMVPVGSPAAEMGSLPGSPAAGSSQTGMGPPADISLVMPQQQQLLPSTLKRSHSDTQQQEEAGAAADQERRLAPALREPLVSWAQVQQAGMELGPPAPTPLLQASSAGTDALLAMLNEAGVEEQAFAGDAITASLFELDQAVELSAAQEGLLEGCGAQQQQQQAAGMARAASSMEMSPAPAAVVAGIPSNNYCFVSAFLADPCSQQQQQQQQAACSRELSNATSAGPLSASGSSHELEGTAAAAMAKASAAAAASPTGPPSSSAAAGHSMPGSPLVASVCPESIRAMEQQAQLQQQQAAAAAAAAAAATAVPQQVLSNSAMMATLLDSTNQAAAPQPAADLAGSDLQQLLGQVTHLAMAETEGSAGLLGTAGQLVVAKLASTEAMRGLREAMEKAHAAHAKVVAAEMQLLLELKSVQRKGSRTDKAAAAAALATANTSLPPQGSMPIGAAAAAAVALQPQRSVAAGIGGAQHGVDGSKAALLPQAAPPATCSCCTNCGGRTASVSLGQASCLSRGCSLRSEGEVLLMEADAPRFPVPSRDQMVRQLASLLGNQAGSSSQPRLKGSGARPADDVKGIARQQLLGGQLRVVTQ